jgi:hypothetical protein
MPTIIKDGGVYDSPQHFFANYIYNLVQELVLESEDGVQRAELEIPLHEDKNLREVQVKLLQSIATGFEEKCKYLKDEHGKSFGDQGPPGSARGEANKPKRPHHDESLISQIVNMGFERSIAKKALKATGDVSNAVTFLLESPNLDGVSDSEEEKPVDEATKAAEAAKAKEEEERQKKEDEERKARQEKIISVEDFKNFVKIAQQKGLEALTRWATFSPEQARIVPLKTQRKYAKLFDSYVLSLARSSNQSNTDRAELFDKRFGAYTLNVKTLEKATSGNEMDSAQSLSLLYQETKNNLGLLHRMTKIESYEKYLHENRKDSFPKLIE